MPKQPKPTAQEPAQEPTNDQTANTETSSTESNQSMSETLNDTTALSSEDTDFGFITKELGGIPVDLPRRTKAGMTFDERTSFIVDEFEARQFFNTENANAKNRASRGEAAWTAEQYVAKWNDYHWQMSDEPRQSALDKMRSEAAWRFWVARATAHNKSLAEGNGPVHEPMGNTPINLRFEAQKGPDGKVTLSAQDRKNAFIERLLTTTAEPYASGIAEMLEVVKAERAAKPAKAEGAATPVPAADEVAL